MFQKIKQHFIGNLMVILIITVYLLFISRYFDYIPMWDSWDYLENAMMKAVNSPFSLFNFDFFGHISFVFGLTVSFFQYFDPGNTRLIHLTSVILVVISSFAYWNILKWVFRQNNKQSDLYFLLALYLFFPVILGSTIQPNPDIGILVFFLLFVYFLLNKNYRYAVLTGIGLIFTKETGLAIFSGTLASLVLYKWLSFKLRPVDLLKTGVRHIYVLSPLVMYLIYVLFKAFLTGENLFIVWLGRVFHPLTVGYTVVSNQFTKVPISYFLLIFILNFSWILSLFAYLGLVNFAVSLYRRFHQKYSLSLINQRSGFIYLLFLTVLISLYIYKTFGNPRYFLPLYPLLIILFYKGLSDFLLIKSIRTGVLAVILIIFLTAGFTSVDPLSKVIYGTFSFGKHQFYNMTTVTGECCGYGRDQLVYNLEYTNIHYILNEIFIDIRPDDNTIFAFVPWEGPYVVNRVDKNSFQRTLKTVNTIDVSRNTNYFIWRPEVFTKMPLKVYFIQFPNNDPNVYLDSYSGNYRITGIKEYDRNGYSMKVYTMELKN